MERARQPPDYGEAELLPESNRALIRDDDGVELHRAKPARPGLRLRMLAHRGGDAATLSPGRHDVTAIADVGAEPRLVGLEVIGPENPPVGRAGDEGGRRDLDPGL